jgi:uncharacterized protein YkwD
MRSIVVCLLLMAPNAALASDLYLEVFRAINSIRANQGLSTLKNNSMLASAAQSQSDWMAEVGRMDHMRESASSFSEYKVCNHHPVNRVVNSGYVGFDELFEIFPGPTGVTVRPRAAVEGIGEIIAWAKAGADAYRTDLIVAGWMRSPGHRKDILNPAFRDMGVGITSPDQGEVYWCVVFGRR